MLGIRLIGLGILVETLSLMQERLLLKDLYRAQV